MTDHAARLVRLLLMVSVVALISSTSVHGQAPPRGYQNRPCGFDMNHNGITGEPADCNVCDARTSGGKVVANTTDPDGDDIDEDLIYVDCDTGNDVAQCGLPGKPPCRTIEYAWDNIADGPGDGAEDIVCFTGTCSPDMYRMPIEFNGVPGYWIKRKAGSEARNWQFPSNPAMLVGWDTDDDGKYPPFDPDDHSLLSGAGRQMALRMNWGYPTAYYEMAHFRAVGYGVHNSTDGDGHLFEMFATQQPTSHNYIHDLALANINREAGHYSGNITFRWFNGVDAKYIAVINVKSAAEGGYTIRGQGSIEEGNSGPWRFQNLTVVAHGCDLGACDDGRARKSIMKLWGYVEGIEVLDSYFDADPTVWEPVATKGIIVNGYTRDWDIVNNEIVDFSISVVMDGDLAGQGNPRYTDDIVVARNFLHNEAWEPGDSLLTIAQSGGNGEALQNVWIQDNILSINPDLSAYSFVKMLQGNTDGAAVTNIRIVNNTFFGRAQRGLALDDPKTPWVFQNLTVQNNIFSGLVPGSRNVSTEYAPANWQADFNVFDPDAEFKWNMVNLSALPDWRVASGGDMSSRKCTPRFVDAPEDLHLRADDGCAKDRGGDPSMLPPMRDIDFDPRPQGSGWDIGADEWPAGLFTDDFESGDPSRWSVIQE